jgi:hypothetical protein
MIRTLLIITGASLVLCIAAGAGALALGGRDLARHGWTWTVHDRDGDSVRFERVYNGERETRVTRTLAWTGGDRLQVEVPGEVVYVQGAEAGVTVEGPKSIAERVRVIDGRLTTSDGSRDQRVAFNWTRDGLHAWSSNDELRITVTAPAVKRFDIRGSSDVSIRAYDQPTLDIDVSGSSSVDVAGRAATADLDISGSGDLDLEAVEVREAAIDISGSGDVRVGPTQAAVIDISGSGDVSLTRRPARLEQDISGSGDVDVE